MGILEEKTGWIKWKPTDEEASAFYTDGTIPFEMHENQYLIVVDDATQSSNYYCYEHGKLRHFRGGSIRTCIEPVEEQEAEEEETQAKGKRSKKPKYAKGKQSVIHPRNDEQHCAFDLIQDSSKTVKLLTGSWGTGKAQPDDTLIPTPNGIKQLKDLELGDYVFTRKGKPTQVQYIFPQGSLDNYKVTFSDGRYSYCNDLHIWTCCSKSGKGLHSHVLSAMLRTGLRDSSGLEYQYYIPINKKVRYPKQKLPEDPYIFGKGLVGSKPLVQSIPDVYLQSSVKQRFQLIRGLMDNAGEIDEEERTISCVLYGSKLASQVQQLFWSLGFLANVTKRKFTKSKYILVVDGQSADKKKCFTDKGKKRLAGGKRAKQFADKNVCSLAIVDIEKMPQPVPMRCIYVKDKEHLYLTNDYIVTHNTMILVTAALEALRLGRFKKIVWIRNNVDVKDTKDLGALPGEVIDKLLPYLGPFIDHAGEASVRTMITKETLEVEPLQSLRGRNFENTLILCSEAENLTKEHLQLIIARAAEGSEVWIDGDCRQRDRVSFEKSKGLETMIERLSGEELFGHVHLIKSERSATARLADKLD